MGDSTRGGGFLGWLLCTFKITCWGKQRGEHAATQIARYVGKYLYSLNPNNLVEEDLLKTDPVVPYLEATHKAGIRSSGILHRILAHKAAIQYMALE